MQGKRLVDKAEILRRGFDAFARRDPASLEEMFDARSTWHIDFPGVLSGRHKGIAAILDLFAKLGEETGGTYRAEPLTFAVYGDRVFVLMHVSGTRNGVALDAHQVLLATFEGTFITDIRTFWSDPSGPEFWR